MPTKVFGPISKITLTAEGEFPARLPLHPFGSFSGNGISFVFDASSLDQVMAQLKAKGVPFVLDLHHATLKVEENKVAEAPAMGWITGVVVEDNYVWGEVEWTELGQEKAKGGGYGFISPVLLYEEDSGHVVGYHSHALTNRPGIRHQRRAAFEEVTMHFKPGDRVRVNGSPHMKGQSTGAIVQALYEPVYSIQFDGMEGEHKWYIESELDADTSKVTKKEPMKPMKMEADVKEFLLKLLGLAPDATDEQIPAALEAMSGRAKLGEMLMQSLELAEPTLTPELRSRVIKLAANEGVLDEIKTLQAQLEADRKQRDGDKVDNLVKAALEAGKISPDEQPRWTRLAKVDFEGTQAALEGMPKRVPTKLPKLDEGKKSAQLSEAESAVATMLNLSPEQIKKYGGE